MAAKGHWPKGKPRHPETANAATARWLARVGRFFLRHRRLGPTENPVSLHAAARAIGVSDRTVRRWLQGTRNPDPDRLAQLKAWRRSRPER